MKKSIRNENINVRAELSTKKLLLDLCKSLDVTQADVIEISLQILCDTMHGDFCDKDKLINILSLYRDV